MALNERNPNTTNTICIVMLKDKKLKKVVNSTVSGAALE